MSKTKIQLELPFSEVYKSGYLITHQNNRKYVTLVKFDNEQTSISYARYLMSVHLGVFISPEFEVDHKNNDKTDDRIENLQLLTKIENQEKEYYRFLTQDYSSWIFACANCDRHFALTEREIKMRLVQKVEYAFCSRSCASQFQSLINPEAIGRIIDSDDQDKIKQYKLQGLSSYKISELTGFARNTVMKYWK